MKGSHYLVLVFKKTYILGGLDSPNTVDMDQFGSERRKEEVRSLPSTTCVADRVNFLVRL